MMNIVIGADIVLANINITLFTSGDTNVLLGEELKDILQCADFRIFNL